MKIKQKHTIIIASLCAALAACSDEMVDSLISNSGKTPIELNAGYSEGNDQTILSRAVISDGTYKTKTAFSESTSLYMLMKSVDVTDNSKPAKVTRTIMFAVPETTQDKSPVNYKESSTQQKNEEPLFTRYWEDSYSRNSALSIVAVCTPGMGPKSTTTDKKTWTIGGNASYQSQPWTDISNDENYPKVSWPVGKTGQDYDDTDQSKAPTNNSVSFIKNQDLCFSNNIEKHGDSYDHRLKFNFNGDRKFDSGTLIFYHALSKFTFLIKGGAGFTTSTFKFNENKNIALENFYNKGTFNLENGEFDTPNESTDKNTIKMIYQRPTSETGYDYTLDALVVPGTDMSTTDNALVISIANNEYKISRQKLYEAIKKTVDADASKSMDKYFDGTNPNYTKLKAGIHYVFSLTIGKTQIEKITAQLVPWETITASNYSPDNARIDIQVEDRTNTIKETGLDIYRTNDDANEITDTWEHYEWFTDYTKAGNKATLDYDSEHDKFTLSADPVWYWENNMTYYHFRSVQPANHPVTPGSTVTNATDDEKSDYLLLTAGSTASGACYTDVKWGAPFKKFSDGSIDSENEKFIYDLTNAFDGDKVTQTTPVHQIYKAIGPTPNTIVIIPFHMMSDVTINLATTNGADAVNLDGATVKIVGVYPTGKALMSNGKVIPTGTKSTNSSPTEIKYNTTTGASPESAYRYGAIPQDLTGVSLIIQTADNNRFIVDMTKLYSNTAPPTTTHIKNPYSVAADGNYYITRWYPGFKYVYNLNLTKKGIDNFKATIVDWEEVTVNQGGITIQ